MRDIFPHQIRKMVLSISCWAIYLTSNDEFIMVTIPVAIMKCHPKIGPWLKWKAEIPAPIIVKFPSLWDPSFFCWLILLSMLLCLPRLKVYWNPNEFSTSPFSKSFSLIVPCTGSSLHQVPDNVISSVHYQYEMTICLHPLIHSRRGCN